MNKKGITFGIIIIIIISIGLLFTGIYSYFNNEKKSNNQEEYNNQINLIMQASKLWIKENKIKGDITLTICELEKNNYIGPLVNPLTKKEIPNDSKIIYENGEYKFIEGKYNLKMCSSENIYTYVELDTKNILPINIPINENAKKIIIKENGEEVEKIYQNKKTTYEIIYMLNNNQIETKYLIIRDTTKPTIDIDLKDYNYDQEANTITIKKGYPFIEPKATITDNSASTIITNIDNNVDIYKVGNYEIIYTALDEDNNKTEKKINITVKSDNENENYYIETNSYTSSNNITLKLKGLNTTEICVSNNSICENWINYTENLDWTLENNSKIYVYYKTNSEKIYMETIEVYLDLEKPNYLSSKKVLLGPSYNLNEIINASDNLSGIKTITTNGNILYKPNNLGLNKLNIEITDNATNQSNNEIEIITYTNLKCDNSISSIVNENGLIKDNNKCIYIGQNPNNYIKVNNQLYRIISIETNNTLKIIKDESISNEVYGNTNYPTSNIKKYLNNYLNQINSKILTTGIFSYSEIKENTVSSIYTLDTKRTENSTIGAPSITDYLKAGSCDGNTTWDQLLKNNPCKQNNWMFTKEEYWLANINANKPLYITKEGNISYTYENSKKSIKPVIYLKSNLGIISGNGTKDKPYIIDETIEPTTLTCKLETTKDYELSKTLTVKSEPNVLISFDGINFANNNQKEVSTSGIITAYVKNNKEIASCSIRLYEEYEYRYKTCPNTEINYSSWYIVGTVKESNDYIVTSKTEAEKKYLNHYEEINNTPCNNCKWITKYERKVETCKDFSSAPWSPWSNIKPEENASILMDKVRTKYGTK